MNFSRPCLYLQSLHSQSSFDPTPCYFPVRHHHRYLLPWSQTYIKTSPSISLQTRPLLTSLVLTQIIRIILGAPSSLFPPIKSMAPAQSVVLADGFRAYVFLLNLAFLGSHTYTCRLLWSPFPLLVPSLLHSASSSIFPVPVPKLLFFIHHPLKGKRYFLSFVRRMCLNLLS